MSTRQAIRDNTPTEIIASKGMTQFYDDLDDDHNREVAGEAASALVHLAGHIGVPETVRYLAELGLAFADGMVDEVATANDVPTSGGIWSGADVRKLN